MILSKSWSWRFCKIADAEGYPALFKTVAFEIRDKKDGLMPNIFLRHRFWKPSKRLISATFRQILERLYKSLDSISALKILIFVLG